MTKTMTKQISQLKTEFNNNRHVVVLVIVNIFRIIPFRILPLIPQKYSAPDFLHFTPWQYSAFRIIPLPIKFMEFNSILAVFFHKIIMNHHESAANRSYGPMDLMYSTAKPA
jgi:hypothetical protein